MRARLILLAAALLLALYAPIAPYPTVYVVHSIGGPQWLPRGADLVCSDDGVCDLWGLR